MIKKSIIQNIIFWKWSIEEKNKKSYKQNVNDTSFHIENKREEIGTKLSQREMIAQIGLNPFLQNSYGNDITNYDNCMKAKNQF